MLVFAIESSTLNAFGLAIVEHFVATTPNVSAEDEFEEDSMVALGIFMRNMRGLCFCSPHSPIPLSLRGPK